MFQSKSLFEAGLKIIGVITIIWSLTQVTPVVFQFFSVYNQPDLMTNNDLSYYRFSLIFQVLSPVILFIVGIYLLKSGKAVVELAFRREDEVNEDSIGSLFILFMKLAGLGLIIYALPTAFQLISNIMFTSSVQSVGADEQTKFIVQNSVKTIISLLLGLYLLMSGKIFYKLGFTKAMKQNS